MRRILLFTVIGFTLLLFSASGAFAFGTKDVVKMTDDGIADSIIILKIENSGKTFRLDADDIYKLKKDGVSDEVISAMLKTEGRDRYEDDYYYDRGAYYYPQPYYSYPYSRLYVGFGYRSGGYYSPYYGGRRGYYSYPRYRPYSGTPSSGTTTRYRGSYGTRGGPPPSGGSASRPRSSGGSGTRTRTR